MALIQRRLSGKKQLTLTIVMALVFLLIFLILYVNLWRSPVEPARPTAPLLKKDLEAVSLGSKSGLEAWLELQKSPLARRLRKFGAWPLSSEPRGRSELFAAPAVLEE